MPISSGLTTTFLLGQAQGLHDFRLSGGDTFKMALIKPSMVGTYGPATTSYTQLTGNSDEASGTGYVAGGTTLTRIDPVLSGSTIIIDFVDASWPSATSIQTRGCMIYNDTLAGKDAILLYDFGATLQGANPGGFTVQFPVADVGNAIIRLISA